MMLCFLLISLLAMGSCRRFPAASVQVNPKNLQLEPSKAGPSKREGERKPKTAEDCEVDLSSSPESAMGHIPFIIPMLFQTIRFVGQGSSGTVKLMQQATMTQQRLEEFRSSMSSIPESRSKAVLAILRNYKGWYEGQLVKLQKNKWLQHNRKVYVKSSDHDGEGYAELYINMLLRNLDSDHVAKFLGYGVADKRLVLFFEDEAILTEKGHSDLFAFTQSVASRAQLATALGVEPAIPEATEADRRSWAAAVMQAISAQVRKGLGDLHNHGIVHGDPNVYNLILTQKNKTREGAIKFIDFGLAWHANVDRGLNETLKTRLPLFNKSSAGPSRYSNSVVDDQVALAMSLAMFLKTMHSKLGCRIKGSLPDDDDVAGMVRMLFPEQQKEVMRHYFDIMGDSEDDSSS